MLRKSLSSLRALLVLSGAALAAACTGGVSGSNVNTVTGSTPYTIGGTVSGLTGSGLVLQNNGGNNLSVAADGSFTFTTTQVAGNAYNVTVLKQPTAPNETCVPSNAVGTVGLADVTNVTITCTAKLTTTDTIGGTVVGLVGSGLVLQDNGTDSLAITADGAFTFATPLASATPYSVTVLSPPSNPNQNCVVTAGSGTTGVSDVNNVAVACTTTTSAAQSIGGTVSGLPTGASLILDDNGGDALGVSANGAFTFKTPVPSGSAFNVTIASISDPSGSLSCAVQNPGGVVKAAAVTNVAVVCSNNTTVSLVGVQVSVASPSIAKGLNSQFIATGIYSNNSTQNITALVAWVSSNTGVATITPAGVATATGLGTTTVSASLGGFSSSATLTVTAATLAAITVTDAAASIAKGLNDQFTATGTYTDLSTQNLSAQVTWASSAPTVAPITATGLATGATLGATTISASLGTVHSNAVTLTVTTPTLVSIAVTGAAASIAKGLNDQFTATGTYTDQSTQNLTTQVTWASSAPTVAPITATGLATGATLGATTISASLGTVHSNAVTLTVTAPTLVSIAVTGATASIAKGLNDQFTATGTYTDQSTQNLTTQVTWASSAPTVAPITATGLATGAAVGGTTIAASLGTVRSNGVTLTVTAPTLVSIAVTGATASIPKGRTDQFTAIGTYTDQTTQTLTTQVTWASSAPTVATIAATGLATGAAVGNTLISASLTGVNSNAVALQVTAPTLVSIAVTGAAASIPKGRTDQFTAIGTYTDQTTQTLTTQVTWASSAPTVATIAATGLATGAAVGNTLISASLTGVNSNGVALTVTAPTLVSIAVTGATASIAKGLNDQFTAIGTYTDQTTQTLTTQVTWASSAPTVAPIAATGLATGAAVGNTLISASLTGVNSNGVALTVTAPTLVSIAVTGATASIPKGRTDQFTAIGTYTDQTTQTLTTQVTWASSAPTVATIAATGLATGAAVGNTLISASLTGVNSNGVALTVTAPTLVSIAVTGATASIPKGRTDQFTAIGTYTDQTTQTLTTQVTWASSTAAATIAATGVATGAAVGNTLISASLTGVNSNGVALTVTAPTLVSIAVTGASASVAKGLTDQFTAIGTYTDQTTQTLTTQVTWASSTAAATIAATGVATGAAVGNTLISASLTGVTSNAVALQVTAPTLVSILVTGASASVAKGLTDQFTAIGTYTDQTTQTLTTQVTWASSTAAATIAATGVATGAAVGNTLISASLTGVNSNAVALAVTQPVLESILVTAATASVAQGQTDQFTAIGTYSDLTTQTLTTQVTWASSNPAAATITASGVATGVAVGSTLISASLNTVNSNAVTLSVTTPITISAVVNGYPKGATNNLQLQVTVGGVNSQIPISQGGLQTTLFSSATGTPYTVSVVQEPGDAPANGITSTICSIADSNNGTMGSTVSDTVPAQGQELVIGCITNPFGFVYVTNASSNSVIPYVIQSDGTLLQFGEPTQTCGACTDNTVGQGPQASAIVRGYLYVANAVSSDMSVFSINPNTGELAAVSNSPFQLSLTSPSTLTVGLYGKDPALYVTNNIQGCNNTVSAFDVAGGGANFTAINTAINAGPNITAAAVDATYSYYYVTNFASATCTGNSPTNQSGFSAFGINSTNPALSFISQTSQPLQPLSMASEPGSIMYEGNTDGSINAYEVDTGGTLSIYGTVYMYGGTNPRVNALAAFRYFTDYNLYAVAGTTGLQSFIAANAGIIVNCYKIPGAGCQDPLTMGTTGEAVAIAAIANPGTGAYIYVANSDGNIYQFFAIDDGGDELNAPAPAATPSITSGSDMTSIVVEQRN